MIGPTADVCDARQHLHIAQTAQHDLSAWHTRLEAMRQSGQLNQALLQAAVDASETTAEKLRELYADAAACGYDQYGRPLPGDAAILYREAAELAGRLLDDWSHIEQRATHALRILVTPSSDPIAVETPGIVLDRKERRRQMAPRLCELLGDDAF
jgi:hypothetical protein